MKPILHHLGQPGLRFYLIASLPFVAAFMLVPASLYLHAGEDWDFTPNLLVQLAVLGLAAWLVAGGLVRLIAVLSARAASLVASAFFALGLWMVLAHVYAPVAIGPLDGALIESNEPLTFTLLEAAFLLLAAAAWVQLARGRWQRAAVALSVALAIVGTGYLALALLRFEPPFEEPADTAPERTSGGSVYHFVLDEMQTDAFLELVDELELRDQLRGFELFRNNISNYRTTHTSSASYFTGTLYRNGGLGSWRNTWKSKGLFESLSAADYRVWMYAPYENWRDANVDHFWYMRDVYERESGTEDSGFVDFALVWLLSLVPNNLTNEAVPALEGWSEQLARTLVGDQEPLTIPGGLNQAASIMMLRLALQHEDLRADHGEYVYVHAILPHGPFVVDRACRLVGREARDRSATPRGSLDREAYLDQGACAVRLITDFLDRLRQQGRYDDATIIIHADTGFGRGLFDPTDRAAGPALLGFPPQQLISMVNAVLMIKRPHATGELEVVDRPTQLVDLYPTLIDLLALPPPDYPVDGRPIFKPDRHDVVFAIDPKVREGQNLIELRVDNPDDLENSALTVLGPPDRRARSEEEEQAVR